MNKKIDFEEKSNRIEEFEIINNCIKKGFHFFIEYDEKNEKSVLRNMLKYNINFLLLRTNKIAFLGGSSSNYV